jgi:predicted permease
MAAPLTHGRIAARALLKQPAFTLTVVGMLSVAIGANTAIFSLIDRALLRALPFGAPERLVLGRATFRGVINPTVSGYDYYDYRDESRSFERLAAVGPLGLRQTVLVDGQPDRVDGMIVTWDLFRVLRAAPALGRDFAEADGAIGHDSVAIISDAYWQRRFGGSPAALGRTIVVDGLPRTIIGVMPPRFRFMAEADVWTLTYRDGPWANARRFHNLRLVGRLASGVTVATAQAEVDVISARLEQQYPDSNRTKALRITPLQDALAEDVRGTLWLLMGAVALVLLMACANTAGLLLARGQRRVTEVAVRAAIGASRATLVRQFLSESLLLALVSGGSGLVLAVAFQRLLFTAVPVGRITLVEPGLNLPMLGFTIAASVVTGLAFGVLPALSGSRVNVLGQLRSGTRTTEGRVATRLRDALVVLQVALGVLLLVGAGLLLRSLTRQVQVDLGFDPSAVLTAGVRVSQQDYPDPAHRTAFFTTLVEEVKGLPGVRAVGLTSNLPLRGGGNYPVRRSGENARSTMDRSADFRVVLPGYFEAMRMPLVAGRDLADNDTADRPRVTVISQSLATNLFPGENPIGQTLIVDLGQPIPHEVVGVVGDARLREIRSDPFHAMYMSFRQTPQPAMYLAVRSASDPSALLDPLRDLLHRKDATVPLAEPATMTAIVDETLSTARIVALALGLFAVVALVLALVGLYGVLAYYVAQHQQEIGVRMALGASARDVLSMVLGRGLTLTAIGLVAGLAGAVLAGRVLSALLYRTTPTDPVTFALVGAVFAAVSVPACLLPAWRAARANPVDALRVT